LDGAYASGVTSEGSGGVADATLREFASGQKLFGRYTLIKILGRGGMGIVWLARDEELEREVALKFFPDLIIRDSAALSELKHETKRCLELTHPHIVRVYDFVHDERSGCISMEYIDGETLASLRCQKEQKVFEPVELSIWVGQLCDALHYAHHRARIIHRDLKSANLMVNRRGNLKVSDFGIARSLGDSLSRLTMEQQGRSGTLVYMSPQQLDGERGTPPDDIYSLGATLYDLLTSKPPFYSGNIDRQIHERVAPSMTERRQEFDIEPALLPPVWEQVVAACLAKDPARRPQSALEVAQRLQLAPTQAGAVALVSGKRTNKLLLVGVAIGALVLLMLGGWYLTRQSSKPIAAAAKTAPASTAPPGQRIGVLPFKPLTPENRDQVLEMGMADSLITRLSNSSEVIVPSLSSVRKYADSDKDALTVGRELQVNSVLEGNVQKSGDHIRVTARLINVTDGSSLWGATFDEKFTDVFALEDAISQKVADALALRLTGKEKEGLTKRSTESVEAYQLYLMGRYQSSKLTPPDIRKAIGSFQQAIALDPNYALAYSGLAELNRGLAITSDVPSKDCLPQAKAAAKKALEIDDSLAEAHAELSLSLIWYDWDWAGGEREAKRAIAVNPNSAYAHFTYAAVLSDLGRHDEAIAEGAKAIELEPVSLLFNALQGMFLHHARRDDQAFTQLQKTLQIDPNFWVTHLVLGGIYAQQQKFPEAVAEFTKAKELSHGNSQTIGSIGYVAGLTGDKTTAQAVLGELKTRSAQAYIPPCNVALVYNGLGNQDEVLRQLEKAVDERDVRLNFLKVAPTWDSFRSNPRFIAILKRIGLQ
jgi:serine/threonine protein kinase/tetratricopeptide (TPR) repeat protein